MHRPGDRGSSSTVQDVGTLTSHDDIVDRGSWGHWSLVSEALHRCSDGWDQMVNLLVFYDGFIWEPWFLVMVHLLLLMMGDDHASKCSIFLYVPWVLLVVEDILSSLMFWSWLMVFKEYFDVFWEILSYEESWLMTLNKINDYSWSMTVGVGWWCLMYFGVLWWWSIAVCAYEWWLVRKIWVLHDGSGLFSFDSVSSCLVIVDYDQ